MSSPKLTNLLIICPNMLHDQKQDEIIPHLEPGRLPSTVDPDAVHPPDKGKRMPQRPVRISAWKLAKLDSNEAVKAGAKARASSSVLRPLGSKHQNYDPDHLSSSNVSGISSPTSTNQDFFRARSAKAGSKSSYPPSRASREDIETCDHSISNMSSPLPPNLTPSPFEQRTSNADHFNPMYQSSANQSPWSAKANEGNVASRTETVSPIRPPKRNNLGTAADNTRPSSVFWDQEAGRFVSAATRNLGSSSQATAPELTYTGQSIFFGGPLVSEQLSRGTGNVGSQAARSERGSTSSYYPQGRAQRGEQLPVFAPSDSQQNRLPSKLP